MSGKGELRDAEPDLKLVVVRPKKQTTTGHFLEGNCDFTALCCVMMELIVLISSPRQALRPVNGVGDLRVNIRFDRLTIDQYCTARGHAHQLTWRACSPHLQTLDALLREGAFGTWHKKLHDPRRAAAVAAFQKFYQHKLPLRKGFLIHLVCHVFCNGHTLFTLHCEMWQTSSLSVIDWQFFQACFH